MTTTKFAIAILVAAAVSSVAILNSGDNAEAQSSVYSFDVKAYESQLQSCTDETHGGMDPIELQGVEITQLSGYPDDLSGFTSYTEVHGSEIYVWLDAPDEYEGREFRRWCNCALAFDDACLVHSDGQKEHPRVFYSPAPEEEDDQVDVENNLSVTSTLDGEEFEGVEISNVSGVQGIAGTTSYQYSSSDAIAGWIIAPEEHDSTEFVEWSGCNSSQSELCWVSLKGGSSTEVVARYEAVSEDEPVSCEADISAAIDYSNGRVCTQQIQQMSCSHDAEVTYNAPDGCQISFLEDRGWEPVDASEDEDDTEDDTSDREPNTLNVRAVLEGEALAGVLIEGTLEGTTDETPYSHQKIGEPRSLVTAGGLITTLTAPMEHEGAEFALWEGCDATIGSNRCQIVVNQVRGGAEETVIAHYTRTEQEEPDDDEDEEDAPGSGLTENQVKSILSLLESFGVDEDVIQNVGNVLRGAQPEIVDNDKSSIPEFLSDLQLSSRGEEVRRLQEFLNRDPETRLASSGPGSPGSETEYFGELTRAALIRFQQRHSLNADGSLNAQTRERLNELIEG